jgi:hypothetical protein
VLLLTFGDRVVQSREDLAAGLHVQLTLLRKSITVTPRFPDAPGRLADLIETLHERTGQRVVVLVDEYDKPILDNLTRPETARVMRDGLRDIYSV